jgi:alkylation response protein AidB-like acyl-CoA dehydrogenase
MKDLLRALEQSYRTRCGDPAAAMAAWLECAAVCPPSLAPRPGGGPVPSTVIALESGDLGLALLWIVQAAVVRTLAADIAGEAERYHPDLAAIPPGHIGALAHSEDAAAPVIAEHLDGGIRLSGKKKYITGGRNADFILVTARGKGDDKVSSLVYVPCSLLAQGALTDLDLGMLRTANHASLALDSITLPADNLVVMDPAALRRHLKRRGLVERFFIMEAFLGAMLYLARRLEQLSLAGPPDIEELQSLLELQRRVSLGAVAADRAGERISTEGAGLTPIIEAFSRLGTCFTAPNAPVPDELSLRYRDLTLFNRFR